MNLKKQIWILFKLDRSDYNKANEKIEQVLIDVFEKGRKAGKKEMKELVKLYLK